MPTRNVVVEGREAEDRARIKALRQAVQVGVDDLDAGRYRVFDSPGALKRHLSSIASDVLANSQRKKKRT